MLKQRVLTAIVLIPLVVLAIWYLPPDWIALPVALLMLAVLWEWALFAGLSGNARIAYVAVGAALMLVLHPAVLGSALGWPVLTLGALWWAVASLWLRAYPRGFGPDRPTNPLRLALGLLAAVPCYLALWEMRGLVQGAWWIFLLLALVWATDTGGYFAGKRFGRHKMAPQISPNKTLEGLAGGLVFAMLLAVMAGLWIIDGVPLGALLGLALAVASISVVGDLSVSMFKRQTGIKDTGTLFPGHGGALDRLDSLLAAAPVMALGIRLLNQVS